MPINELTTTEQQVIQKIIEQYRQDGYLSPIEITILIACLFVGITSILVSIASYFRVIKTTKSNIISYITTLDINQTAIIENILNKILGLSGANRVAIAMFHNGFSVGGEHLPFKEFTLTYEARKPGTTSLKSVIRKIPLSKLSRQLDKITNSEFTKCIYSEVVDIECKQYMSSVGLECVYSRLLANKNGIYGIIELHYFKENDAELDKEALNKIELIYAELLRCLNYITNNKRIPKV
jgi:hypothetical protein